MEGCQTIESSGRQVGLLDRAPQTEVGQSDARRISTNHAANHDAADAGIRVRGAPVVFVFAIEIQGRHTALGDSLVTAGAFLRMIDLLEARNITSLSDAIAVSNDPCRMAVAFKTAVEAGRAAHEIGLGESSETASARNSPSESQRKWFSAINC